MGHTAVDAERRKQPTPNPGGERCVCHNFHDRSLRAERGPELGKGTRVAEQVLQSLIRRLPELHFEQLNITTMLFLLGALGAFVTHAWPVLLLLLL